MFKRFRWHLRRIRKQFGGKVLRPLIIATAAVVLLGAVAVTLAERSVTFGQFWRSLSWAMSTVLKADDISYVSTPWGLVVHWTLTLFGVAILAAVTGAVVGFVIDFLVKEGQGIGAT